MERKPGRPRALTVEMIARAALDDGVATFSMPSVARRLGVAHSGLYRYVEDREALLQEAFELAALEVTWPATDLPWRDLLREVGESVWTMCDAHPGLDRATMSARNWSKVAEERVGAYVTALRDEGFVVEDAAVAVEFVYTLALTASAEMSRLRAVRDRAKEHDCDLNLLKVYDNDEVWTGRGLYGRKLDILLAGLESRQMTS